MARQPFHMQAGEALEIAIEGADGRVMLDADGSQMRIGEGFIEDVLKNYVTYKTYYKLIKKAEDDPNVERKKAAKALARFMRLHPHNTGQKTEVMVEHFQQFTRHKIGGHAKAMVVTGSRLEAVRYKQEFDRYIQEKGYPIKSLVAFSGVVEDDKVPEKSYTEVEMNGGGELNDSDQLFFDQITEAASQNESLQKAAEVNSLDKFQLVFRQILESLFIERMELNEELFTVYMGKPEMRELVSKWLGGQVYERLSAAKNSLESLFPETPTP